MILKEKITSFGYMFYNCDKIKGITGYIDTSNIKCFSWLFDGYISLVDISSLKRWDISNLRSFDLMLNGCSSLSDLNLLKNGI